MMDNILPVSEIISKLKAVSPDGVPKVKWASEHYQELLAYQRQWNKDNPDKAKAIRDRYYDKPYSKEVTSARNHRRDAIELGATGSHTAQEWIDRKNLYGRRCAYCGKKTKLTKDHFIPLTKGGTNDIGNLIPACKSCNSSKCNNLDWFIAHYARLPLPFETKDTLSPPPFP